MTTSSHSDNSDADDLDPALRDLFATLRARSLDGPDVVPSPALAEFVGVDPADRAVAFDAVTPTATMPEPEPLAMAEVDPRQRRIPVLSAAAALFATLTGKLVLTGGLAAATIGGAHATGVVDVPGLPGGDDAEVDVVTEFDDDATTSSTSTPATTTPTTTTPTTTASTTTTSTTLPAGSTTSTTQPTSTNDGGDFRSSHRLEVDLDDHRLRLDIDVDGTNLDIEAIDDALRACATAVDRVDDELRDLDDARWLDEVDGAIAACNELMAAVVGERWNAIERIPDLDLPDLDVPDIDIPDIEIPDVSDLDDEIDAIQQEIDDAIDDARDAADRAIDEANELLDGVDDLLDGIGTGSADLFD